ncbi:MAG: hypothetical protein AVDCRST_MAG51-2080 [uncultured Ramlibacter sp.]|uniref:BON domain-containing protein n=1 Tax=uncultured Ramlibacter sp. TaxID=260755 RepID=A0A6J4PFX5_9BURK|nr:MAG: hypothetical protein AVDCRST_MAG51-2080 [uncultured Ramlibacter sp.]
MKFASKGLTAASSLAIVLSLAACGERSDQQTVGQKLDSAVAKTGETAREVKDDAKQGAQSAKSSARETVQGAATATKEKAAEAGSTAMGAAAETKEKAANATREAATDTKSAVTAAASDAKDKAGSAASTAGEKVDDAQITARVKAGITADKDLSAGRIDVDTQDGVVTLSGAVPSAAAKAKADEIAKNAKDVKQVNNQLTVSAS